MKLYIISKAVQGEQPFVKVFTSLDNLIAELVKNYGDGFVYYCPDSDKHIELKTIKDLGCIKAYLKRGDHTFLKLNSDTFGEERIYLTVQES